MRKISTSLSIIATILFISIINVSAQTETTSTETVLPVSISSDIVSNYVWRGTKLSSNPSFQPALTFEKSGFTVGLWGSYDFASGYAETDPYLSYETPFGLGIGISDYYLSNLALSNFSDTLGSHALEVNLNYSLKGFSLSGNYIVNKAPGVGSVGGDAYVELAYEYKNLKVFAGGGNGWYTADNSFQLCNIGLGTSKEIKITENFSLPVFGQFIVNPDKEQMFIVFGISL
jgi:hypothetical protein